ncbi:hypothetical protein HP688_000537 [Campylobacter jejuni]|nr:hypothetical protein [Campylobacter jejuni]
MLKPKKMIFFNKMGEGLSFSEIYMNGRTLDLSGLTLNFDQIKTDSNNVFITSS